MTMDISKDICNLVEPMWREFVEGKNDFFKYYMPRSVFAVVLIAIICLSVAFSKYSKNKEDQPKFFSIIGAMAIVILIIVIYYAIPTDRFYFIYFIVTLLLFISGGVLYSYYKRNNDTTLLAVGYTLIYLGIICVIMFLKSRVQPVMYRLLVGIITVCTIATPLHMVGKERQNETLTFISMIFYGMGLAVFISAFALKFRTTRIINCIQRKFPKMK